MSAAVKGREWHLRFEGQRPTPMNEYRKMHHHTARRVDQMWRDTFAWLAKKERMPAVAAVHVIVIPLHRDYRSPQDVAACAPAAKAAIDGLVDAGVLEDDGPAYVRGVTFMPPVVCGVDGLVLQVDEEVA